jgi:ethanolamine permease
MADSTEPRTPAPPTPGGGTTASPEDAYLERRALRRGSAGWLLLAGLGVARAWSPRSSP